MGVDRLDYSKGLPQRMRAFRDLLAQLPRDTARQRHPDPDRLAHAAKTSSAYTDILHELETLCGSINGDYGELDWMPVRYMHRTVARSRAAGPVPRQPRWRLVTPLRDGMNLVAKEYIAAQDPPGSRRAGAVALRRCGGAADAKRCWSIPTTSTARPTRSIWRCRCRWKSGAPVTRR